jgi:hypothetical protein
MSSEPPNISLLTCFALLESNNPTLDALWIADHPHDIVFKPRVSKRADRGTRMFYLTIR